MSPKQIFLHLSKWLGLFDLARYLTRRGLRILCYHGTAFEEESLFRPKLFINYATLQKRLEYLRAQVYPILPLEESLARLDHEELPDCAAVITVDDGFYSTYKSACELFSKFSFPVTIYVTSYYCANENPIFRLVVQYMFWKTRKEFLDLSVLSPSLSGKVSLLDTEEKDEGMWKLIQFGEEQCQEPQRVILMRHLGELLETDFEHICKTRSLSLMNSQEIQSLAAQGIDIQLHTHRHRLPLDEQQVKKEIFDNRTFLEPLIGKPLHHLCYPSGLWSQKLWSWLDALEVKSATTCEPGLNYPETSKLGLKRFLDGENITQIEFEAELSGYSELLRRIRSGLKYLLRIRSWLGSEPRP
jgi:peptidoglycan/xylan/chitin deacetylase (PgdA/CDA1 family)